MRRQWYMVCRKYRYCWVGEGVAVDSDVDLQRYIVCRKEPSWIGVPVRWGDKILDGSRSQKADR
jgi:hypothetical protein